MVSDNRDIWAKAPQTQILTGEKGCSLVRISRWASLVTSCSTQGSTQGGEDFPEAARESGLGWYLIVIRVYREPTNLQG